MSTSGIGYRGGALLVALSTVFWSTSGLFVRLIHADVMSILFWRGIVSGLTVLLFLVAIERGRTLRILSQIGWPTVVTTIWMSTSMLCGIASLHYSTIADSMVIYATSPFVTAILAYMFIGERPSASTVAASLIALGGVVYMVWGTLGVTASPIGQALAVVFSISTAALATVMRKHREVQMLPAMITSSWFCSAVTFWFMDVGTIDGHDPMLLVLFGVIQSGLSLTFYTIGVKHIPAMQASLLLGLEVPLTPLWVWVFLGETPSVPTQVGGAIVLAALFGHMLLDLRRNRPTLLAT